ncbi:winged helix-turn-helix domain-containing protein [Deinococcus marmoris]|uniref:winged helix-turn-helix domain-containing protein n=1 Tax=Deinococcus marmoris TaxID=249408 RepID=UPI000ADB8587|nr:winged helix-turn-helix domain-containing protein [Deinococcus marmoris]
MTVPDFQTLMRPLLESLQDGQTHSMQEVSAALAEQFQLTEVDLQEMLPSGRQATFANRVGWAKTYLAKAQVVETVVRGTVRLTARGRELLGRVPGRITQNDLKVYPEFQAFKETRRSGPTAQPQSNAADIQHIDISPDEQLDTLYAELSAALADELLTQVRALTPQQFEILVVQLLVAMGYGGSVRDAGQALGRSGDNGIDGVVKQDPLGLDKVYVQAKQWASNVGSQEVRNFSGSLTYHKASKGVLITTAGFSSSATDTARQSATSF